uniref:Uncharacterized protein n=1 Tax=Sus scrofa TaxID=9823 RepID=A0A8D1HGD7_PIG
RGQGLNPHPHGGDKVCCLFSPLPFVFQYMEKRNKSREHGNAMRKRLLNLPEESEK